MEGQLCSSDELWRYDWQKKVGRLPGLRHFKSTGMQFQVIILSFRCFTVKFLVQLILESICNDLICSLSWGMGPFPQQGASSGNTPKIPTTVHFCLKVHAALALQCRNTTFKVLLLPLASLYFTFEFSTTSPSCKADFQRRPGALKLRANETCCVAA